VSHQSTTDNNSAFYNSYYGKYSPAQFYSNPDPGFSGTSLIANSLFGINGSAFRSSYTDKQNNLETYLGWNKKFGDHSLNAVVGFSWLNTTSGDGIQSSSTNFITDLYWLQQPVIG